MNVTFVAEQLNRSAAIAELRGLITSLEVADSMLTSPKVMDVALVSSLSVPSLIITVRLSGPTTVESVSVSIPCMKASCIVSHGTSSHPHESIEDANTLLLLSMGPV